jgi:flagellar L-ring protein precursor FlgH
MNSATRLLGVCTVLLTVTAPVIAGSIWAKATSLKKAIHADDTARRVGDLLTVIIAEHSVIENETNRGLDKQDTRSASMGGTLDLANLIGSVGKHIFDFPNVDFSSSAKTKFDGKANYDSDRSVADQITVVVQDVLPNGNLVILGKRERVVSGDKQIIQLSGVVRPSDITFTNTVRSDRVADFRISYGDRGPETRFTKPGWAARILNFLNPF